MNTCKKMNFQDFILKIDYNQFNDKKIKKILILSTKSRFKFVKLLKKNKITF